MYFSHPLYYSTWSWGKWPLSSLYLLSDHCPTLFPKIYLVFHLMKSGCSCVWSLLLLIIQQFLVDTNSLSFLEHFSILSYCHFLQCYSHYTYPTPVIISHFLDVLFPIFLYIFSIASCFQVFIDTFFKNIYFFFGRACSIVIAHQTHFFLSVKICVIHITSLDSFADSPSLPLNWPICSRMLSPFSIRTFNTLITDI